MIRRRGYEFMWKYECPKDQECFIIWGKNRAYLMEEKNGIYEEYTLTNTKKKELKRCPILRNIMYSKKPEYVEFLVEWLRSKLLDCYEVQKMINTGKLSVLESISCFNCQYRFVGSPLYLEFNKSRR